MPCCRSSSIRVPRKNPESRPQVQMMLRRHKDKRKVWVWILMRDVAYLNYTKRD